MKEFNKIVCKTTPHQGWKQAPYALLVGAVIIFGLYVLAFEEFSDDPTGIGRVFFICFGVVFLYWMVIRLVIAWFIAEFEIHLDGDTLTGYNLFGRKRTIKITDLAKLKSEPIFGVYYFKLPKEKNLIIDPAIDYYGFIMDYILLTNSNVEFDIKRLSNIRKKPGYWRYSRFKPYDTKYEEGYLEWLRPQIEEQLEMLQAQGVLAKDQEYIIEEPVKEEPGENPSRIQKWADARAKRDKKQKEARKKRRDEWANRDDL